MKRPRSEIPAQVIEIDDIGVDESKSGGTKSEIAELAKDMTEKKGLLYPIIVCVDPDANPSEPTYKIKNGWGRKRLEAAHLLGWKSIAAVVIPPISGVLRPGELTEKLASLIEKIQNNAVSDYDIGRIVSEIEKQHGYKRSEVARVVGLSLGYMYNLVRWYRNVPVEVRDAWKDDHPHMNQAVLDAMSHMDNREAILHWKKVVAMRSSPAPYSPDGKNGESNGHQKKPHKATETQMLNLMKGFSESPLRDSVMKLCCQVVKFSLGMSKDVNGITNYKKLDPELLDKTKIIKQQKKPETHA